MSATFFNSPLSIETVRDGFPVGRLVVVAQELSVERPTLLHLLGISERTLQRKTNGDARLSPAVSDRLARIDRILTLATDIFGDKAKAVLWLKRPSRALANQTPLSLLDTDAGTQCVERELRQIQFGVVF